MDIVQRIKDLLPHNGVTNLSDLERTCDVSNGTIAKWRTGTHKPSTRTLHKIAEFLNVSTDYLLTGADYAAPALEPHERQLLDAVHGLPPDKVALLVETAKAMR